VNSSSKSDVVCYVQRKRITDWKRRVFQEKSPLFIYGSNDDRVFSKLKKHDSLWVISSIPGRPPELVAHFIIDAVGPFGDPKIKIPAERLRPFREFKWIAKGTKKSEFFGHNDASRALLNTVFSSASGKPRKLSDHIEEWQSDFGQKLRRPTLIYQEGKIYKNKPSPGNSLFEALAGTKNYSIFISYKWKDNTKYLSRSLAYALANEGFMPWLDQLALPRAKATAKINRDEQILEKLLKYGFKKSKAVFGINSMKYGVKTTGSHSNWTEREWNNELDNTLDRLKILYNPNSAPKSSVVEYFDIEIINQDPNEAVKELKNILMG